MHGAHAHNVHESVAAFGKAQIEPGTRWATAETQQTGGAKRPGAKRCPPVPSAFWS